MRVGQYEANVGLGVVDCYLGPPEKFRKQQK